MEYWRGWRRNIVIVIENRRRELPLAKIAKNAEAGRELTTEDTENTEKAIIICRSGFIPRFSRSAISRKRTRTSLQHQAPSIWLLRQRR